MFIVKLILVPLWPFFICSWVNKKSSLGVKGWIAGLLFMYFALIAGAFELINVFSGRNAKSTESAPSAEMAK